MSPRSIVLFVAFWFSSACGGCRNEKTPDAGQPLSRKERAHSIDVRTALFTIFPEFRWAVLTRGTVRVEQVIRWQLQETTNLKEALLPSAREKGFEPSDGGHDFVRAPFAMDVEQVSEGVFRLVVGLPITQTDVSRLLQSPAPMTSDQLAHWLPLPPGAEVVDENFILDLEYQGKTTAVADGLVRQMIDLLLAGPWRMAAFPEGWQQGRSEDGGYGRVPAEFEVTLHRNQEHTSVQVRKRDERVAVRYLQPLMEDRSL